MATLSVVIPTWSATPELVDMTLALCKQVKPMCDELVICEDGHYNKLLDKAASRYVFNEWQGHGNNLRSGIEASSGDYIAAIDSDIIILDGNLRDLVIPDKVVCGKWHEHREYTGFTGWFFVSPRSVLDEFPPKTDEVGPGLDYWGGIRGHFRDDIKDRYVWSDELEYSHLRNRSFGEWDKRERAKHFTDPYAKEVASDRHTARLMDDPVYRERWQG